MGALGCARWFAGVAVRVDSRFDLEQLGDALQGFPRQRRGIGFVDLVDVATRMRPARYFGKARPPALRIPARAWTILLRRKPLSAIANCRAAKLLFLL
jgi:hypothetical protein